MLRTCLKLITFLVAFVAYISTVYADGNGLTPIYAYRKETPKIDGNLKPHKVPGLTVPPVQMYYNADTNDLVFENSEEISVTYYILNESEEILLMDTFSGNYYEHSLDGLSRGQYKIVLECNEILYEGDLVID